MTTAPSPEQLPLSPLTLGRRRLASAAPVDTATERVVDVMVASARIGEDAAYLVLVDGFGPLGSTLVRGARTADALAAAFARWVVALPTDRVWRVGVSNTRFLVALAPLASAWPHIEVVTVPAAHPVMEFALGELDRLFGVRPAPVEPVETGDQVRPAPASVPTRRWVVATDGSSGNRGSKMHGGFGWMDEQGRFGCGVLRSASPLDAELTAIIKMLSATRQNRPLRVLVDSEVAIVVAKAAAARKPVCPRRNVGSGLYSRLVLLLQGRDVEFVRVKGHTGHPLNEGADRLSRHARRANDMGVDESLSASLQAQIVKEQLVQWRELRAGQRTPNVRTAG